MPLHVTHWGTFEAQTDGRTLSDIRPYAADPDPHRLIENVGTALHHPARVDRPYVRRGWLEDGPGATDRRGRDEFVAVDWDEALDRLAAELRRVYDDHGPTAVYGGSYGWASAGRFHHAQSQLKRFLSLLGGFTGSVNNYSYGATEPFLPHVFVPEGTWEAGATSWPVVAEHTELLVAFGGLPRKNAAVASGGNVHHDMVPWLQRIRANGCRFVAVSPLRDDLPPEADGEWLAVRPGTDGALLQAIAHLLVTESLYDKDFVRTHCVGFDEFAATVADRTPEWAASRCGVPADRIVALAREMAAHRTLLTMSWSMQRQPYGEHVVWLGIAVASLLGQHGLPGGGFGHGYGSTNYVGHAPMLVPLPRFSSGHNPVREWIPVARVSDLLLHPGSTYPYDGRVRTFPDIRLVYWAGGNPFHHHQDLKRLRRAFGRPETVVVHESMWTATARHADIVLPATLTVERDDLSASVGENVLVPMPRLVAPYAEARDDHLILRGLASRLGVEDGFTEGRDPLQWLETMYDAWRAKVASRGHEVPTWEQFWADGKPIDVPTRPSHQVMLADYRSDPVAHPLRTPSGRIHLASEEIASFGYDDCPGVPTWVDPGPADPAYPLSLVANQPRTRLHSQLDVGSHSLSGKVRDREVMRMHPEDAAAREIQDADVVRVSSPQGACLAAVRVSEDLLPGVVQLPTGAWYDPDDDGDCVHGNPNVLTADVPTTSMTQGNTGQHVRVQVTRVDGPLPPVTVHTPPRRVVRLPAGYRPITA